MRRLWELGLSDAGAYDDRPLAPLRNAIVGGVENAPLDFVSRRLRCPAKELKLLRGQQWRHVFHDENQRPNRLNAPQELPP